MDKNVNWLFLGCETDSQLSEITVRLSAWTLHKFTPAPPVWSVDLPWKPLPISIPKKMITLRIKELLWWWTYRRVRWGGAQVATKIELQQTENFGEKSVEVGATGVHPQSRKDMTTTRESFFTLKTKIGSQRHQLQTIWCNKLSHSGFQGRRVILEMGNKRVRLRH